MYFRLVMVNWIINLIIHFRDFILNFEAMRNLSDANGKPCCEHELLVGVLYSRMLHTSDLPLSVPYIYITLYNYSRMQKWQNTKISSLKWLTLHDNIKRRVLWMIDLVGFCEWSHFLTLQFPWNIQLWTWENLKISSYCVYMPRAGKCPN